MRAVKKRRFRFFSLSKFERDIRNISMYIKNKENEHRLPFRIMFKIPIISNINRKTVEYLMVGDLK